MGRLLAVTGIVLTALYAWFAWWLIGDRIQTLQTMDLNEVGDFLAGAFGPLAILWLVLGFFQQGIELRQGTEALNLQTSELTNSVTQQTKMAMSQQISLQNYENSVEPLLKATYLECGWQEGEFYTDIAFENLGDYCEEVEAEVIIGGDIIRMRALDNLFTGGSNTLRFYDSSEFQDFDVKVYYNSRSGRRSSQRFTFIGYTDDDSGGHGYVTKKHSFLTLNQTEIKPTAP